MTHRVLAAFMLAAVVGPARALAATPQGQAAAPPAPKAAPAPASSPAFDAAAKKAEGAKEAGRYDEAIQLYRQALKLKPAWTEGRFVLGTMLYDHDRYDEARVEFRTLAQADPKNGTVVALKGLCEFRLKNYERALRELESARSMGVANNEIMSVTSFHVAILLNRFEQFEAAFEILRKFAQAEKDSQGVIEAFGLSVMRMPFLPDEVPAERREMVLMAGRAGFHQAKGRSSALGRQAFEELISRYPTAPNVHYAFGVYLLGEQPEVAIEEFKRELRSSPNHFAAMLQIAYELLKEGRFEEAKPFAASAVELAPGLYAARNALGRALLETGDVEGATQQLEAGVKLAPDSPEMRFALARAYAKAGRDEEAAKERAAFVKLGRARRAERTGQESVGGKESEPDPPQPPR